MYGSMNNNQSFSMLGLLPSGNVLPGSPAQIEQQRRIFEGREQEKEDRLARQDLRAKLLNIMGANIARRRRKPNQFGTPRLKSLERARLAETIPLDASLEMLQRMYDREMQNSMNMGSQGVGLPTQNRRAFGRGYQQS